MRNIYLAALTLVATSAVALAQGANPATPPGAASAAPASGPAAQPPRGTGPSVFGAPGAAASANAALAVPPNVGTLIQQAHSAKVSKCLAKGPGFSWKANANYGKPKADGTPSLTTGSCKARKFSVQELTEAGLTQDMITRVIAVDNRRPN